jgi:hypothetical protein
MKRWVNKLGCTLLALRVSACNHDHRKIVARDAAPAASPAIQFAAPADAAACSRALLEVCGKAACATFDATRQFALARREPGCLSGGIGTCGNFRFVEKDSGFDMLHAYFDDTGALAGLSIHNDTSGNCVSGTIPSCTKNFSEKVCP